MPVSSRSGAALAVGRDLDCHALLVNEVGRALDDDKVLTVNAGSFFKGWTFDQLVHIQGVEPLRDPKTLAGGWPDDEDLDQALSEIYQHRH